MRSACTEVADMSHGRSTEKGHPKFFLEQIARASWHCASATKHRKPHLDDSRLAAPVGSQDECQGRRESYCLRENIQISTYVAYQPFAQRKWRKWCAVIRHACHGRCRAHALNSLPTQRSWSCRGSSTGRKPTCSFPGP
jgi:hypothetical protein